MKKSSSKETISFIDIMIRYRIKKKHYLVKVYKGCEYLSYRRYRIKTFSKIFTLSFCFLLTEVAWDIFNLSYLMNCFCCLFAFLLKLSSEGINDPRTPKIDNIYMNFSRCFSCLNCVVGNLRLLPRLFSIFSYLVYIILYV